MSTDTTRWRRIRGLVVSAMDLPKADRPGYLEEACAGDPALRIEVEGLLEHDAPTSSPSSSPGPLELAGRRIGPFALVREIGSGGMGKVYLAEREEGGFRQRVAIKVLKRGMDTDDVLRRFKLERQLLAGLEHPNIARLYDGGATDDGLPYLALELVEGIAIDRWCDEHRATLRERIELFLLVCSAVHHAHQNLVVHRDLKPSNILVTSTGVPKLLDFGIAKVLLPEGAERTLERTSTEQRLLTPAYASPEQLRGEPITTASDVYSLGVVLCELLVGAKPFRERDPDSRSPGSRDAEKPSTVLDGLEEKEGIGAARRVNATLLRRMLTGDLDTIVITALQEDPARRYPTVERFASDLRRHLDGLPVSARPDSWGYRLSKFARRNKLFVGAGALLLLSLIGGLTASTLLYFQAVDAKAGKETQRQLAEQRADDVLSLSAGQDLQELVRSADDLWPARPEKLPEIEQWLRDARALVDGSPADPARGIKSKPGLADHRRKLAELEARALPQSEEERASERRSHPKLAELERKQAEVSWRKRMLGQIHWPGAAEAEAGSGGGAPEGDAEAIDARVLPLIEIERTVYGGEPKALELASEAMKVASDAGRPGARTYLAWALLANGRFDEALDEARTAVEEASPEARETVDHTLLRLKDEARRWTEPDARRRREEELRSLVAETAALETVVARRRTWSFAGRDDGWWHAQLSALVADLEGFVDPRTGLCSAGTNPGHGWGMMKRLEVARTLEERSHRGSQASQRWTEAIASIRDLAQCPAYRGLEISPQLGLLPIGRDPDSRLWEFADLSTGDPQERGSDGKLHPSEGSGLVLVLIPGGKFRMGAQATDPAGANYDPLAKVDDSPVHEVELAPFFLSKFEMTQDQWMRFTGKNPSQYAPGGYFGGKVTTALHPVENVSWNECNTTMNRLALVIPTEAQWEYGARAGTGTAWWTGDEKESLRGAANLEDAFCQHNGGSSNWIYDEWLDDGYTVHAPVGSYRPNAFGLHDVVGNVWELCREGFGRYSLPERAGDGERQSSQPKSRMIRGGSFHSNATHARSSARLDVTPEYRDFNIGLRPARALDRP